MSEAQAQPTATSPTGSNMMTDAPGSLMPSGGGQNIPPTDKSLSPPPDAGSAVAPEYFDVKVNGKTIKMTRQEALDRASMSYRANEKFDEASKKEKAIEKLISNAKTNPIQALMDPALGLSKEQIRDAFESWYNQEFIEPEGLTEDQRRIKAQDMELKRYQDEEKQRKEAHEKAEFQKLTETEQKYLQTKIIETLEASKLPKTPRIVGRIAFYMRQNHDNGWDAPMDMIVRQVQNERQEEFGTDMDSMSVEEFMSMYGDKAQSFMKKLNSYYLQQLRDQRSQKSSSFTNQNPDATSSAPRESKGPIDYAEVQRNLRKMSMGL